MSISEAIELKKKQLPQMDYMWRVDLPKLGNAGLMDPTGKGVLNSPEAIKTFLMTYRDSNELNHRVFSIDAPYSEFEVTKHTHGQRFFYSAGTHDIGAVNLKIDEYEDGKTLEYLNSWQGLILNGDGSNNPPVIYKRDIILTRLSSSGIDLHVTRYIHCWPSSISPSAYSYDSNSISQYGVTFSADEVKHQILPADQVKRAIDAIQFDIMNSAESFGKGFDNRENMRNSVITTAINKITDFLF